MRLVIQLILAVSLACSAAGCFVARAGERDGRIELARLRESVWVLEPDFPLSGADSSDPLAPATLAALHERTLEAFADDGWQHRGDQFRQRRLVYSAMAPGGLLRVVDDRSLAGAIADSLFGLDWLEEFVVGFRPNATFLTERELARQRERKRITARVKQEEEAAAAALLAQASGAPDPEEAPGAADGSSEGASGEGASGEDEDEASGSGGKSDSSVDELLLESGVDIHVPLEVAPDSKGVMVHLPALMGTKYERRAVQRLRDLGWTILHVRGPTGLLPPNYLAQHEAKSRRSARTRLRFRGYDSEMVFGKLVYSWDPHSGDVNRLPSNEEYQKIAEAVREEIPMPPTGFEAHPGEPPADVAQRIAAAADAGLAETALAAEAALDAFFELHPHMGDRPVVVIGFSAGALAAPAVAVRLGDRVGAVVLVGGGADALTVAQTSSLTRGHLKLAPPDGPEPAPEFVEQVYAAYRELSQLDPYNASPRLGGVPVLQVMARGDEMVPTRHQWTLWERLGRPDRLVWRGPLGHKGLFYFLPRQMPRIDRWVMGQGGRRAGEDRVDGNP